MELVSDTLLLIYQTASDTARGVHTLTEAQSEDQFWKPIVDVLGLVATAIAAGAAAYSVHQAARFHNEQKSYETAQANGTYFRFMVSEPVMKRISEFRDDARSAFAEHTLKMIALHDRSASINEIKEENTRFFQAYGKLQTEMMHDVTSIVGVWDTDLRNSVRRLLEDVHDKVAESSFEGFVSNPSGDLDWDTELSKTLGCVADEIKEADPRLNQQ